MSAAESTRFFRPWNVEDTVGEASVASIGGNEDEPVPEGSMNRKEVNLAISSDSDVSSAHGCRGRLRNKSESSTETSNGSVFSDDATRHVGSRRLQDLLLSSSSLPQTSLTAQQPALQLANDDCLATTMHRGTYLPEVSFQHAHPAGASASIPLSLPVEQDHRRFMTSATSRTFCCEFPGVRQLPLEMFASTMGQAVERVHLQDAAAKQMKKLRPKRFRCELCDVAFSNNGQLKGHIRIHTGERPFKCDAKGCGKSFTRNEELTRHKRIHTGVRPHGCIVCGKHFGRKDHLKKHMRTHENRDPFRVSAAALGMFALGQALPQGPPFPPYLYPF